HKAQGRRHKAEGRRHKAEGKNLFSLCQKGHKPLNLLNPLNLFMGIHSCPLSEYFCLLKFSKIQNLKSKIQNPKSKIG
ncbi:hypothetical protein CEN44_06115, partial [Fischerella muscicola CCMEE 5323]